MQTMAKEYIGYTKSDSSSSLSTSSFDSRSLFSKRDSKKVIRKKKSSEPIQSSNAESRGRSHRFIENLRKIVHHSTSDSIEAVCRIPSSITKKVLSPMTVRRSASENRATSRPVADGNVKLKGILKKSTNDLSISLNDVPQDKSHLAPRKSISSASFTPLNITLNNLQVVSTLSLPDKQVKFNERVSTKKYKSSSPVITIAKVSRRQRKKLNKILRRDSLDSNSKQDNEEDDSVELKFDSISVDASSEDETSDDK